MDIAKSDIDLLKTVDYGGCSAKLDPDDLAKLLSDLPILKDKNVLIDASSYDDAGVYQISDDLALILTTDFFPPVCSDPYMFGRIAATNAISDIYAMGGRPLMAVNLVMYPQKTLPISGLKEIMRGGNDIMLECGCLTMGGHTIEDTTPKYGLAVVGIVNPKEMTANSSAKVGQVLVLSKPLGVGVAIAAHRLDMISKNAYNLALDSMQTLNKSAAEIMVKYSVKAATDVTGFGLIGHARNIAAASNVSLDIYTDTLPYLPETLDLLKEGCIPGGVFRNIRYLGADLLADCPLEYKYLSADPETSGGLLMCVDADKATSFISELNSVGLHEATIIGEVSTANSHKIHLL